MEIVSLSSSTEWSYDFPLSEGPGIYELIAVDEAGNNSPGTSFEIYHDIVPPEITLNGVDPAYVEIYTPYSDEGATATDDYDGDLTPMIEIDNPVNTDQARHIYCHIQGNRHGREFGR